MTLTPEPMPSPDPSYNPGHSAADGYEAPPRNGLSIAALVLGILALITSVTVFGGGVLLGIIAIVLGFVGRSRAKKGHATNGGVALAGIITGAIGLVLSMVLVLVGAALFLGYGRGGNNYVTCLNNAHGDQAAISHCSQ